MPEQERDDGAELMKELAEAKQADVLEGELDLKAEPAEDAAISVAEGATSSITIGDSIALNEDAAKLAAAVREDEKREAELRELLPDYVRNALAQRAREEAARNAAREAAEAAQQLDIERNILVKRAALTQERPSRSITVEVDGLEYLVEIARLGVKVEQVF